MDIHIHVEGATQDGPSAKAIFNSLVSSLTNNKKRKTVMTGEIRLEGLLWVLRRK